MKFTQTEIPGVVEILPRIFSDDRGFFLETYNETVFHQHGLTMKFVQDNQSFSKKGVLRGLHFQLMPHAQGKLVSVNYGRAIDVVVDLRFDSPTFGKHLTFELDAATRNMVYVPEGCAHGFSTLEDTIFVYKCTNVYNKAAESGIIWDDKDLNIDWGIENPLVSEKDLILGTFADYIKLNKGGHSDKH